MAKISEDYVPLAAEDRFLIVSIRDAAALCPGAADAAALGEAIRVAKPFLGDLIPMLDLRGLPHLYSDVGDFIDHIGIGETHVLVNPNTAQQLDLEHFNKRGIHVLSVRGQRYKTKAFDLSGLRPIDSAKIDDPFYGLSTSLGDEFVYDHREIEADGYTFDHYDYRAPSLDLINEVLTPKRLVALVQSHFPRILWNSVRDVEFAHSIRRFFPRIQEALAAAVVDQTTGLPFTRDMEFYLRAAFVHAFLRRLHRNSLLVEYVMTTNGNSITCSPYHGSAIHEIERPHSSEILVGRPAIVAERTRALFSAEIAEFQRLLNDPETRERHLQKFLEEHKHFLSGLNYSNIYPQIILQRDDGTQLRPDFLLEPYDDMWCDILDIKLPTQSIIVGSRDRATLAAGIHEVAAQLREYSAYFEEEKYRRFVREKYGLQVYKPRLIAIVGRDLRQMSEPQFRRAMTAYENIRVMTFDELVRHSQSRLLL